MIREAIALTRPAFVLMIPRHLRRAAANADRFYGGPPFGREPVNAPNLYDPSRDLDGMERAARIRAQAIKMRQTVNLVRSTCKLLRRPL